MALIALEAYSRRLAECSVPARVGDLFEPALGLGVQILVVEERAAVEETLAQVADRPLHFALGPGPVRPAGARPKSPVRGKAQELAVEHQAAAAEPLIGEHDGTHLIKQQLLGYTAEALK